MDVKICPGRNYFKWPKEKVKTFGVWLWTNPDNTVPELYDQKLERGKAILGCWKFR